MKFTVGLVVLIGYLAGPVQAEQYRVRRVNAVDIDFSELRFNNAREVAYLDYPDAEHVYFVSHGNAKRFAADGRYPSLSNLNAHGEFIIWDDGYYDLPSCRLQIVNGRTGARRTVLIPPASSNSGCAGYAFIGDSGEAAFVDLNAERIVFVAADGSQVIQTPPPTTFLYGSGKMLPDGQFVSTATEGVNGNRRLYTVSAQQPFAFSGSDKGSIRFVAANDAGQVLALSGFKYILQSANGGTIRRVKSKHLAWTDVGRGGTLVGVTEDTNHALLLKQKKLTDLTCALSNSQPELVSADATNHRGDVLARTVDDHIVVLSAVAGSSQNYCVQMKAAVVGDGDRYFQNDPDAIRQTMTYPLDTHPKCSIKVQIRDANGAPLSGKTVVLLAGSAAARETKASTLTDKNGNAVVSYPITTIESQTWEVRFWNDKQFRSAGIPIYLKTL